MLTLIQWALYSKQYKTVKFLTLAGSDADYKYVCFQRATRPKQAADH